MRRCGHKMLQNEFWTCIVEEEKLRISLKWDKHLKTFSETKFDNIFEYYTNIFWETLILWTLDSNLSRSLCEKEEEEEKLVCVCVCLKTGKQD